MCSRQVGGHLLGKNDLCRPPLGLSRTPGKWSGLVVIKVGNQILILSTRYPLALKRRIAGSFRIIAGLLNRSKKHSRTAEALSSLLEDEIRACKSSKRKLKNNDCNQLLARDGECL